MIKKLSIWSLARATKKSEKLTKLEKLEKKLKDTKTIELTTIKQKIKDAAKINTGFGIKDSKIVKNLASLLNNKGGNTR